MLFDIVMRIKLDFIECFGFYSDLVEFVAKKLPIPFNEINLLGGRSSGKTFATLDFLSSLVAIKQQNAIYVFRQNISDAKKIFSDYLNFLEQKGLLKFAKINHSERTVIINGWTVMFEALNETRNNINKGAKVGFRLWTQARYVFAFFEETSQLDFNLVKNSQQSLRGTKDTQVVSIFASNPWTSEHWYIENFNNHLAENEFSIQQKPYYEYSVVDKKLFLRSTYRANKFTSQQEIEQFEWWKDIDYSKYRVISLGLSGSVEGAIYARSLSVMHEPYGEYDNYAMQFFGGMDWGDGTSSSSSDTACLFGSISKENGIEILDEMVYNNNVNPLTSEQQIELVVRWFIKKQQEVNVKIVIYIDNAHLRYFYETFNATFKRIAFQYNMYGSELVFAPAIKHAIWDRVVLVNYMLASGKLRFSKNACPKLYKDLKNCYVVLPKTIKEDTKKERSHEHTHTINALEYLMCAFHLYFYAQAPAINEKGAIRYGT